MNYKTIVSLVSICFVNVLSAATPIHLEQSTPKKIKDIFMLKSNAYDSSPTLKKTNTHVDFNQTAHVRMQQMHAGVPVWDATSVIHIPHMNQKLGVLANINQKTTMNGILYQDLNADLVSTPVYALSQTQQDKALQTAKLAFEKSRSAVNLTVTQESVRKIIFVDDKNTAHYAYLISFYYDSQQTGAHRPTSIIDSVTLETYREWDGVLTEKVSDDNNTVLGGGIGGNIKMGEVTYDGAKNHLPALEMSAYDIQSNQNGINYSFTMCLLKNDLVSVYDMSYARVASTICAISDKYNGVHWLSLDYNQTRWKEDGINGGYSPSLDAFYNATIVSQFFDELYNIPALVKADGITPMPMIMRVHYGHSFDNAFWDGEQMTFGDGGRLFYPLTSLDITAHEICHGFTEQHSQLDVFKPQMRALHEAFSDEAAVTIQYYASGKLIWDLGRDVLKNEGALRYLDNPTKDGSSIDNMKDFNTTECHAAAGIFNKAFYLIATSKDWNIMKAFNILIKANMDYWTSSMSTLSEAACGVLAAAEDHHYNTTDVRIAFIKVGIETDKCGLISNDIY
jgi:pseudolysin